MTVNELKSILDEYNGSMNVKIGLGGSIKNLADVTYGIDADANVVSVWLVGDEVAHEM